MLYQLALVMTPKLGPVTARKLLEFSGGSVRDLFACSESALIAAGLRPDIAGALHHASLLHHAEQEMEYMEQYGIRSCFFTDPTYPERLRQCEDAPLLLFYTGDPVWNTHHVLSVVGTRSASAAGKEFCEHLITDLACMDSQKPLIISGLAYGIDVCAHRSALKAELPTIAVFGTPLQQVYPSAHIRTAEQIRQHGALISEFYSNHPTFPGCFIRRNRIIAGMSDATLVVESRQKGGSLITADIANSYNREVFAVPGRPSDLRSEGCNWLIRTHRAHLVTSAEDLMYIMGWEASRDQMPDSGPGTPEVPEKPEEQAVLRFLREQGGQASADHMLLNVSNVDQMTLRAALLNLEISGRIKTLPGGLYRMA